MRLPPPALAASFAALVLAAPLLAQRPTLSNNVKQYVSVDTGLVAITNVTLIDGTGSAARRNQTVVLRDGRIESVGDARSTRAPAGALSIDGSGHTLIPGLVGLHDHLYYSAAGGRSMQMSYTGPRLYLASGVTTIRTTGSQSPYSDINLKRNVEAGNVPGPRVFVTSPYITGEGGGGMMSVITTPEEARRFVAYWAEEGASWIKFYTNISREAMAAAIDEAHKHNMRATGHLCSVTFREAIDLGIDDLAHGAFTATDFIPDKQPDHCPAGATNALDTLVDVNGPVGRSLIQYMVQHHTSMTTTMAVIELFYQHRPVTDQRVLDMMAPDVRTAYAAERNTIDTSSHYALSARGFQHQLDFDRAFFRAGGLLANGVDPTGNGGALPGFGDQRGYELLREAGFSAEEAVQVCTLNGARILGIDGDRGSIARGKAADLVLLNGDLTQDPSVIRNVETVFKDGVGYDATRLLNAVRGRVGLN
jgi:imidazolonepropionase-like amidohydrolase